MNKNIIILLVIILISTSSFAQEKYNVKKGDTLWDIAGKYYNDNMNWPLIWKYNTFIQNPDLIYPKETLILPAIGEGGDRIKLSSNNNSFKLGEHAGQKQTNSKNVLVDDVSDTNKYSVEKKPAVKSKLNDRGLEQIPYALNFKFTIAYETLIREVPEMEVVATQEGKHFVSSGDVLRINAGANKNMQIGQPIIIFNLNKKVDEGYILRVVGYGKIKKVDDNTSLVLLEKTFDSISKGYYASEFEGFDKTNPKGFISVNSDLEGKIIYLQGDAEYSGQGYRCIVDIGHKEGVKQGDILYVIRTVDDDGYKRNVKLAEIQVIYANDISATAMIIQSDSEVKLGDYVVLKKIAVQ
jgi:hypothetical protein